MQNDFPKSLRIKKIIQETPVVRSFLFEYPLGAKPGQFVNVWVPGIDEKPMSIAFDDGKTFMLAIANIGHMTKKLFEKKVGDFIGIRGPYGTHFQFRPKQKIAMVAGGYGAAPLYFTAYHAVKKGCTVYFLSGTRTKELLLFTNRIRKLKGVKLFLSTNDGSAGSRGTNVQVLEKLLSEGGKITSIMTCGPELMMKKVSDLAWKYHIPAQISVERYMKCGFGICGNCCVDDLGIPTCQNGPVLDNRIVRQIKEFGLYHRNDVGRKHFFKHH